MKKGKFPQHFRFYAETNGKMKKNMKLLVSALTAVLLIAVSVLPSFAAYEFKTTTDTPDFSDDVIILYFEEFDKYGQVTQGGSEEGIQKSNSYENASGGKTIYLGGSLSSCEMSFDAPVEGTYSIAVATIPYSTSAPRIIEFKLDGDEFTRVDLPQTADKIVTFVVVENLTLTAGTHTFTVQTPADYDNKTIKTAQLDALYIDLTEAAETEAPETAVAGEETTAVPETTEAETTAEVFETSEDIGVPETSETDDDASSAQTSDGMITGAVVLAAAAAAVIAVSRKRK